MNEREALKLALEALDCICSPLYVREIEKIGNAMKSIKETLAQPEQEPDDLTIAYMSGFHDGKNKDAPQRTWVGLTDKEMEEAMDYWSDPSRSAYGGAWSADSECVDMVRTWRYIEAKLKDKNGC